MITIGKARYAKGMVLVTTDNATEWKRREERLIAALRGRYTHRERGYVMTPTKATKLLKLFDDGWDANSVSLKLRPPENLNEQGAA